MQLERGGGILSHTVKTLSLKPCRLMEQVHRATYGASRPCARFASHVAAQVETILRYVMFFDRYSTIRICCYSTIATI